MSERKIEWLQAQEIAEFIFKIEESDDNSDKVDEQLAEKWGIDIDIFQEIAQKLFEMIDFGVSPLTDTPMIGFSTGQEWVERKDITSQFINGLIQWMTEGEEFTDETKGFTRLITSGGKPEFEITISRAVIEDDNSDLPKFEHDDPITKKP